MDNNERRESEDLLPEVSLSQCKKVLVDLIDKMFAKMDGTAPRCIPCSHPELDMCKHTSLGREKEVMGGMVGLGYIVRVICYQLATPRERLGEEMMGAIERVLLAEIACKRAMEQPPRFVDDIIQTLMERMGFKAINANDLPGDIPNRLRAIIDEIKAANLDASSMTPNDFDDILRKMDSEDTKDA